MPTSGAKPVLWGMLAGLAGTVLLGRVLRREVFLAPVTAPTVFAGVIVVPGAVMRAARLDPIIAPRRD